MRFKINDRVIYTSGKYGDFPNNPLWNGEQGRVIGTLADNIEADEYDVFARVEWDNGTVNSYLMNDIILENEEPVYCNPFDDELFTL